MYIFTHRHTFTHLYIHTHSHTHSLQLQHPGLLSLLALAPAPSLQEYPQPPSFSSAWLHHLLQEAFPLFSFISAHVPCISIPGGRSHAQYIAGAHSVWTGPLFTRNGCREGSTSQPRCGLLDKVPRPSLPHPRWQLHSGTVTREACPHGLWSPSVSCGPPTSRHPPPLSPQERHHLENPFPQSSRNR